MNTKGLCLTVLVFTVLIFGGNHLAVSGLIADQKKCDCNQLKDLVANISNAVYVRKKYRDKIRFLRKLDQDKAVDEFNKVTIEIRPAQSSYQGSKRNGVRSYNARSWPGSFVFVH